jgi:4,5-DOPA dioxygenase extradiol
MSLDATLTSLASLPKSDRMPVLFMGHGSPMNAIETNVWTDEWRQLGSELPVPTAVLCISAHWLTRGTAVTSMLHPRTIHDFQGFPRELFSIEYPAPGAPDIADATRALISSTSVHSDHDWGLDYGAWSVLRHMFPDASIPIVQLSIDYHQPGSYHVAIGQQLRSLRDHGVLLLGSGNLVHNLGMIAWDHIADPGYAYPWAEEANSMFKAQLLSRDIDRLTNVADFNAAQKLAVPTPDHYWPMLYTLGATGPAEEPQFFTDSAVGGSLTMTSVRWG